MTQIELLNKIRREIERLKKLLEESTYYLDSSQQALGYSFALDDFENFLDTLQEPSLPSDVEEAAEKYAEKYPAFNDNQAIAEYAFKAGAEWQYQKDREEFAKIKAKTWCEGFDAHKEQMLEDAVEGEVYLYESYKRTATAILVDIPKENLGDKVRIVVLKDKEER